jgi:protein-tyrosine-phosphatase
VEFTNYFPKNHQPFLTTLPKKISLMTDYCSGKKYDSVPDPYFGGAAGFELVLDILEDACKGLIHKLQKPA